MNTQTTTATPRTPSPRIKFVATPGLQVGGLVRHFARGFKFWAVIEIRTDGIAVARAIPTSGTGCC